MTAGSRGTGLAFLGCGWATRLHSRTLRGFGGEVRRYYASRDGSRATEYAARFGGAGSFGSYEAALASRDVDVVLIATPPSSHLELSLRAKDGLSALDEGEIVVDRRPPDVIRIAPVPLYNTFHEVWRAARIIQRAP